ncbi:MAG: FAD-dependent monooxygenase [Actinobacteria bacterium]|nr:FAD-dependent monooxygenase [Actinomycetota bacterium]
MRVAIVGGGPAGLYLAILLLRDEPGHDVVVFEQNPRGATFGWGVVFSEDTLTELRDADYETWLDLDRHLVRWGGIDIHRHDETVRASGHGFSAIRRLTLLQRLAARATALGADVRYETAADALVLSDEYDVVVAADGVHSPTRQQLQKEFGSSDAEHGGTFAWFGTDHVFEVFTFIFRETDHGLFTVHAYPFDAGFSTFIVECDHDTWRRAGLDTMTEDDSLAFCHDLFADHLRGGRLLSNRSVWRRFTTVRNRSWHHRNVVLVGDAAHTAHFSIGSGTKLAMEDAIALSKAFVAHPGDPDAAFTDYELERQGPVERFQEAAIDSADYFLALVRGRYRGLSREQFVFNLLTRSGRILRSDLQQRDPRTVAAVDRNLRHRSSGETRLIGAPPSLASFRVGSLVLANRIALQPPPGDTAREGTPGTPEFATYGRAAATGAGLIITEPVAISAHGRVTSGSPGLYRDEHVAAWRRIVETVHGEGAVIAARLGHSGRRGATRPRQRGLDRPLRDHAWTVPAPSPLPYTPWSQEPATAEADGSVIEDVRRAAHRAREAGFDLLLLDASDGYLFASYLSPLTNHRDDHYGGDLLSRLRYPLEAFAAAHEGWGEGPVGVRLTVDDRVPGGLTADDGVELARAFVDAGAALVAVAAGHTVPRISTSQTYRRRFLVPLADRIRNEAGARTLVGGNVTTFDEIDTIVAAGRADLVVLDPVRFLEES